MHAHEPLSLTKDWNCTKSLHRTIYRNNSENCGINNRRSEPKEETMLARKCRTCSNDFICVLYLFVLSIFIQKKYSLFTFASNLPSSGCGHASSLFANEEQKMLVCDIFDGGFDYDVSATGRWAQHGSTHVIS